MHEEELMYGDHIALTATRSDEEPHRIDRLNRVIGYVCAASELRGDYKLLSKVEALHDHKGALTVRWSDRPTEEEKRHFSGAWQSAIGDGDDNVEHEGDGA
jgi:hypothetical protein